MGKSEQKRISPNRKETLRTDKGVVVDLLYYDDMPIVIDEYYRVDLIEARTEGSRAGHIRISYIPKEAWEKAFPTILHFVTNDPSGKICLDDLQELVKAGGPGSWSREEYIEALEILDQWIYGEGEKSYKDKSLDELVTIWAQKEVYLEERYRDIYNQQRDWLVDKPQIEYVRVYTGSVSKNETPGLEIDESKPIGVDEYGNNIYQNYRGQGIGTLLYEAAAKSLKDRGMNLYKATNPSKTACRVWDKLKKKYGLESEDAINASWGAVSRLSLNGSEVELERADIQYEQPKLNNKAPLLPESGNDNNLNRDSSSSIVRD